MKNFERLRFFCYTLAACYALGAAGYAPDAAGYAPDAAGYATPLQVQQ